jgi:hypothetical protein
MTEIPTLKTAPVLSALKTANRLLHLAEYFARQTILLYKQHDNTKKIRKSHHIKHTSLKI